MSASPVELVEPLARALGMTAGLGTRSAVADGVYTGELAGPFCYGPGKVEAMTELARWEGYDLGQCYAYSDSASDLPMLARRRPPGGDQPRRQARTRIGPGRELADRRVQREDQGGGAPHHPGGGHRRASPPEVSPPACGGPGAEGPDWVTMDDAAEETDAALAIRLAVEAGQRAGRTCATRSAPRAPTRGRSWTPAT